MSDPSTPPASPRRPWTLLGRLAKAMREQNWFAVVLELVIVVLGVVIGFQVTAWGQERADRAQEQEYLRQLAEDLRETEQLIDLTESASARRQYPAATGLLRTWGAPEAPPRDSVLSWVYELFRVETLRPVLETAEALIATGNITLVSNDSLQTAITTYVEETRHLVEWQTELTHRIGDGWVEIGNRFNFLESRRVLPDTLRPALARPLISGLETPPDWNPPFALDVGGFYADQEAFNAVWVATVAHEAMGWDRATMRENATVLRAQIEAVLNR